MRYHRNAKTNVNQRVRMKESNLSSRDLAEKYEISHVTAAKWKNREDSEDRSSVPHTIHYAVDPSFWRIVKKVRLKCLFTLDDLFDSLVPYIPHLNRDNCYRILVHYKINKLSDKEKEERKKFATYKPGYLHIDVFYLPKLLENGKKKRYYCFLAIDRATRMLFLEIYEHKDHEAAADFLVKCLNFFPFRIHTILTDNGKEFTLKEAKNRWGKIDTDSFFDVICKVAEIKHRLTKVKHPWTNGMAERAVKTVKGYTTKIHIYQDISQAIEDIKRFQNHHNFYRRLRMLGRKSPYETAMEWFVKEPNIFIKNPTDMHKDSLRT